MAILDLTYQPAVHGSDPEWTHRLTDTQNIVIQDARAYGGNLPVHIFDVEEGCLYHFGEQCTMASAHELAARILVLVESCGGNIETAHDTFHGAKS